MDVWEWDSTQHLPLVPTESNHNLGSMVTQLKLLTSLLANLKDSSPSTSVDRLLADMTQLRDTLTSPNNLRVVMTANINTLSAPLESWKEFLPKHLLQRCIYSGPFPLELGSVKLGLKSIFHGCLSTYSLLVGIGKNRCLRQWSVCFFIWWLKL